ESLDHLIVKNRSVKKAAMQQLLTGRTRLPGFNGKWKGGKLGEFVSRCKGGSTPSRTRPEFFKGRIPWITSGELKYERIVDTKEHVTEDAVRATNLEIIPAGTFVMAITGMEAEGTRGSCGIVGTPSTMNQSCLAV